MLFSRNFRISLEIHVAVCECKNKFNFVKVYMLLQNF